MGEDTAILSEIRDLLREIRGEMRNAGAPVAIPATGRGMRNAGAALPARARTNLAPSRGRYNMTIQRLLPYADQIRRWRDEGRTYQQISALLAEAGVQKGKGQGKSCIARFCRNRLMVVDVEQKTR